MEQPSHSPSILSGANIEMAVRYNVSSPVKQVEQPPLIPRRLIAVKIEMDEIADPMSRTGSTRSAGSEPLYQEHERTNPMSRTGSTRSAGSEPLYQERERARKSISEDKLRSLTRNCSTRQDSRPLGPLLSFREFGNSVPTPGTNEERNSNVDNQNSSNEVPTPGTNEERNSNVDNQNSSNEECPLDAFLKMKKPWTIEEIEATITAEKLCREKPKYGADHIERVFKINKKLKELADTTTENTEFLQNLADKVEDFAVQLLDQVHTKEEASICDGGADRYGSLFSEMTKNAIICGQKKFVSHPFLFKRVKMRWQRGSPFKSVGILHVLLRLLLIPLETIFTPFLLPVIVFVSYRDQKKRDQKKKSEKTQEVGIDNDSAEINLETRDPTKENLDITSEDTSRTKENSMVTPEDKDGTSEKSEMKAEGKDESKDIWEKYFDYINTPLVIFIKTEFMKVIFIALHCRICILGSTVLPSIEEGMVFPFFLAVMLSEYEQWRTSKTSKHEIRNTVYFKDMWNWIDLLTMFIYIVIVILRVVVILQGGDPFHNRLLEIANYCYGFNTMFLILRLSSVLELSEVFGPLQLALFKMVVDLTIILVQFAFVIAGFSVALAKIYSAEMSYLMSSNNQTANSVAGYEPYCTQGAFKCLYKAARQLVWSVFGIMESTDLESHTRLTSEIVGVLYLIFLILSVIMLVNILVALLTNTYEKYKTNWEVEWKFGLAVVEEQYARRHAVVIPYNLLTYPILQCYLAINKDTRDENANRRKKKYDLYIRKRFIPITTERYLIRYEGSFPLSVDEKLDNLHKKVKTLEEMNTKVDTKLDEIITELKKRPGSGGQSMKRKNYLRRR